LVDEKGVAFKKRISLSGQCFPTFLPWRSPPKIDFYIPQETLPMKVITGQKTKVHFIALGD
jgi:hypothetical protein